MHFRGGGLRLSGHMGQFLNRSVQTSTIGGVSIKKLLGGVPILNPYTIARGYLVRAKITYGPTFLISQ